MTFKNQIFYKMPLIDELRHFPNVLPMFNLTRKKPRKSLIYKAIKFIGWAHQDSNLGPIDYESTALTD
jgi:hypothetical protein